jgi:putative SOS response-associated peptidase YedK
MCSRYEAPTPERLREEFDTGFDPQEKLELWPGYEGPFLRKPHNVDPHDDAVPLFEADVGVFGLLPFWADKKLARSTYNARSETASVKRSFKEAWKKAQHCIIPAVAIYEPDWRTGKAIPTRISRTDGRLLGIAGLWEERKTATGDRELSFSMLTVNADDHALMRNFHRPGHEKRMVVVLPQALYQDWLTAPVEISSEFMTQYPADRLVADPQP